MKKMDEELLSMLTELMGLLNDSPFNTKRSKHVVDSMLKTFSEVMVDNTAFRKLLADPAADISQFEPIIKIMMSKKKPKKKAKK